MNFKTHGQIEEEMSHQTLNQPFSMTMADSLT